jgi:glycerol kinase
MASYIAAIDQGTTSTRCLLFDHAGTIRAGAQQEHDQIFPRPGWVEHDADQIRRRMWSVIEGALAEVDATASDIAAVGITNQRETAVMWDRSTGKPLTNAIVWQDTRTDRLCRELGGTFGPNRFAADTGLPLATYFTGPKVRWAIDNIPDVAAAAASGDLAVGTVDSWVVQNLSGGEAHVTDVTNASRTMLMHLGDLSWDPELCEAIGVPIESLPEIRSSSEVLATATGPLAGVPIAGILGDQQAALFGQACTEPGEAKSTYGTGSFMLLNTGTQRVGSDAGLLSTVAYRLGDEPAVYALEGSIAVAGSLIQWLRDNLGIIDAAPDVEDLALTVEDNGDVYIVPAFSGLFAPYWRDDARGVVTGLTGFATKGHFARAALEAVAYQTMDVLEAMRADARVDLKALKVDGGMVVNDTLMQFQADILDLPVVRPEVIETTALGAAYAAGLAVGFWESVDEVRDRWAEDTRWTPNMDGDERARLVTGWKKAVERTLNWVD